MKQNKKSISNRILFYLSFILQAYHVTDAALGYFSPKQSHNLSILRLQSCWELTNHGIVNIGELKCSLKYHNPWSVSAFCVQEMQSWCRKRATIKTNQSDNSTYNFQWGKEEKLRMKIM